MVGYWQRSRAIAACAAVSAVALCVAFVPAFGQESGGPLFTFGIATTLSTSDNADLDVVSAGDTTQLETTLSFGFESITRTQALRFSFSDTLREGRGPDARNNRRGPNVGLSYERQVANARLDIFASKTTRDVNDDLIEEDLDDPDVLIVDRGTRTNTDLGFSLETGLQGPVGTAITVSQSRRSFSNTTDPDLEDNRTRSAEIALILRSDAVTEARLTFSETDFEEEDAVGTERTTRSVGLNVSRQLDPATAVVVGLGWITINEDQTAVPLSLPEESGLTASLGYARELPAGAISAEFRHDVTDAGGRTDLEATRSFDLPTGAIDFTFGVSKPDGGSLQPIGRVAYSREIADQSFSVALSSLIAVNTDRDIQRRTRADMSYSLQINDRDSLGFDVDFAQTSAVNGSGVTERTRASATASYSRALTPDWILSTGLTHRRSRTGGADTAQSNTAFVTLGREFSWRAW